MHSPLDIAIIGSGPSAFFCADYLSRLAQPCRICMFERWPSPYGLVRGAIAPDHMHIRRVTRAFERIAMRPAISYFGNVDVGRDIGIEELAGMFHVVLVATGAQRSRIPAIPGMDLSNCCGAAEFAGWYNGRPDCVAIQPNLSGNAAVVIGAGNVALDMARMLAWPCESLAATDISSKALAHLAQSTLRDIHVVARRGPLDARFTPQELELLKDIPRCAVIIHEDETFSQGCATPSEDEELLLRAYAAVHAKADACEGTRRRIHLHFHLHPHAVMGDSQATGVLFYDAYGAPVHIPAEMVIAAIGQTGEAIPGLPFNEDAGTIPHCVGRILDDGRPRHGFYVAGWIKRGASGVIGTNKPDCRETVQSILDDRATLIADARRGADMIGERLQQHGVRIVNFEEWKLLDKAEQRNGTDLGKAREPFCSVEAMLNALEGDRVSPC